jgi:hypothetical protein
MLLDAFEHIKVTVGPSNFIGNSFALLTMNRQNEELKIWYVHDR